MSLIGTEWHPDELADGWFGPPKGDPGDWESCHCYCHISHGQMKHVMACCMGGWKKTFQRIAKEMSEAQAKRLRDMQNSVEYKPSHGGYPE